VKRHKFFTLLTLLTLLATFVPMASASPPRPQYTLPEGSAPERLDVQDGVTAVPSGKTMARGEVRLWLELAGQPLVALINASGPMTPAAQLNYRNVLDAKQSTVAAQAEALGAVELARMNYLVNLVAVRAPASSVAALRAIPGVVGVYPVVNGAVDLVNSVPWIGAERAQEELGFTGDGVTIAIIDTGIDYTHASFGGPGTEAAYTEAMTGTNAMVITDTFATGWSWPDPRIKVITGTDFVGPYWDGDTVTALSPDPDPLDDGPGAGHGTHVGSTAAGLLVTDTAGVLVGQGVAPDADLFAYKVCSSVSTSCDGIAMVQGMEQAVIDGADVINMSIGATYGGAYESYPTTVALTNAAEAGLLVAVSSGNSGNLP